MIIKHTSQKSVQSVPLKIRLAEPATTGSEIRVWEEDVSIPTYEIGAYEKTPIFLEKRVYQGSTGAVYPYPITEKIFDEKKDKIWRGLFLENEYIKMMVLPELGGRIHMAFDKIRQRHFVYFNQVIKPALVGLTGPWISGGIEFNWPQHHRPSTYLPVDFSITENRDGSCSILVNEVERMCRTKGLARFTLYPGKAFIEIDVRLYNRTSLPQTFLWWANPAVAANDDYQSVFPPDVHAVFDHGKRDVSEFPIARGVYYKVDYSPGTDISRYKNIPVPTSYMAVRSDCDFVGAYEHDTKGGLLHVANHHVSPGKKQWTWGRGDFGGAWDRNLTDEDGPYVELMTGVFTDNQPDFSWLAPYEEKSFTQYFMPYAEVDLVKNATREAMIGLERRNGAMEVRLYTTSIFSGCKLSADDSGKNLFETTFDIGPETPQTFSFAVEPDVNPTVTLHDRSGRALVSASCEIPFKETVPKPARAIPLPEEIAEIEQLYLSGLHLEQYRHATFDPLDYYDEALRRSPSDIRCNNAKGKILLRRALFAEAERYFEAAVETMLSNNPNPYDGEALYNLGLVLQIQGKLDAAYTRFFKATWNAAWAGPAFFSLAQIALARKNDVEALEHLERALDFNQKNGKAQTLNVAALRHLARTEECLTRCRESLQDDPFNIGVLFEQYLLLRQIDATRDAEKTLDDLKTLLRGNAHSYIEYALDYIQAGLWDEALTLLSVYIFEAETSYPIACYLMAYCSERAGRNDEAFRWLRSGEDACPDYCFPNRIEEVVVLEWATRKDLSTPNAHYYLGNFRYAFRQYATAVRHWETAVAQGSKLSIVHRNIALAYYNKLDRKPEAVAAMELARELAPTSSRLLMELDQLSKKRGISAEKRLAFLETHETIASERDDLHLERTTLLNQLERYEEARRLLETRTFHPWEGGEGKVTTQWKLALIESAKNRIRENDLDAAESLLKETFVYPLNLGEGKLYGTRENDVHYLLGYLAWKCDRHDEAVHWFGKATFGSSEPAIPWYYNDQQPDKIFYQALAFARLEETPRGRDILHNMIDFAEKELEKRIRIDYFAVSLPDIQIWEEDLQQRHEIHCHYLLALGFLGLDENEEAMRHFKAVLARDPNHLGALVHRRYILDKSLPLRVEC